MPATPTSYAVCTSHPVSSAMMRASSATGMSTVPAVRMPTLPPVRSGGSPCESMSTLASLWYAAVTPLPLISAFTAAACSPVTLVAMHLPVTSRCLHMIRVSLSESFPSARTTSGSPHLTLLPASMHAIPARFSMRSPSISCAASSTVTSPHLQERRMSLSVGFSFICW